MAHAALVSLQQTINQILNHDHSPPTLPVNQKIIRSISDHAVDLQSFLEDFPEKADSLEGEIREVANAAEDVMECILSETDRNPSDRRSMKATVGAANAVFERQLKEVAAKFMSTAGDMVDYFNDTDHIFRGISVFSVASSPSKCAPTTTSKEVVVGFRRDAEVIRYRLSWGSSKLQVLPIVGMGGIGKTTLAKIVYNQALTSQAFSIYAWVTISQDYSVGRIVLNLLASMKGIEAQRDAQTQIANSKEDEIQNYLMGGKYLVVMDDMWSKKAWDDVRNLFPDNRNGSRIILTTRLQDVAAYANPSTTAHTVVRFLSPNDSWSLLRHKVFGDQLCPPEIESAGKAIAARCRGLPLSIVVVAGILSKIDKFVHVWKQIAESDGQLETIMSLSYIHLPHQLKSCFLYMGGFPEDYEIHASELTKLWIAEGFVKCPNGFKTFEEEAEDCLDDLVERSLVLVTRRNFDSKIKSCKLHDMVRDFCIRQGRQEKLLVPLLDYLPSPILRRHFLTLVLKNHKRISATCYDLDLKDSMHSSRTRSIICIPRKGYKRLGFVQSFKLLRVLHVLRRNDYRDWELSQVFDLIYLTYLASNIPTNIVPPTISQLQNLQTLIIYRNEVRLPVEIWRLRQLRHLIAFSFHPLPHPQGETPPLENLQTLSLAMDFVCSERMVQMIPNIQKLGIRYSEEIFEGPLRIDYLTDLFALEKLKLERHSSFRPCLNPVFPMWLKKLTLSGWRLPWRDMMIVGWLPYLQTLKLRNYACDGIYWETTGGHFYRLKLLLIDESYLQYWLTEGSHFPSLERLMLHRCPRLSEIHIELGDVPTLELIEVDDHNQTLFYSAKRIHQCSGNEDLQVRLKRF